MSERDGVAMWWRAVGDVRLAVSFDFGADGRWFLVTERLGRPEIERFGRMPVVVAGRIMCVGAVVVAQNLHPLPAAPMSSTRNCQPSMRQSSSGHTAFHTSAVCLQASHRGRWAVAFSQLRALASVVFVIGVVCGVVVHSCCDRRPSCVE